MVFVLGTHLLYNWKLCLRTTTPHFPSPHVWPPPLRSLSLSPALRGPRTPARLRGRSSPVRLVPRSTTPSGPIQSSRTAGLHSFRARTPRCPCAPPRLCPRARDGHSGCVQVTAVAHGASVNTGRVCPSASVFGFLRKNAQKSHRWVLLQLFYGLCFKVRSVWWKYCYPSFFVCFYFHETSFSILLSRVHGRSLEGAQIPAGRCPTSAVWGPAGPPRARSSVLVLCPTVSKHRTGVLYLANRKFPLYENWKS